MPMPKLTQDAPLPVTVIGGYLGAGKTTLVNHLLRHAAGRRIAVLVNDFGALPIDADLIEAADGDVLSLAGGCVCCSFGSDLMGALMKLARRAPRPDQLLVETSGVALPGAVAASLSLLADVLLEAVVVLADAESVRARAADRYLADTIERQLHAADLVVLNKLDLVAPQAQAALRAWLAKQAPRAAVIDAVHAQLPVELLLGVERAAARRPVAARRPLGALRPPPAVAAETLFERIETRIERPLDVRGLGEALADPALGVIRAKGILRDAAGAPVALQLVGLRATIQPLESMRPAGGRLVCIGLRGRLDSSAIRAALERAEIGGAASRTS
jgi:G3E family GTPase